MALFKEEHAFNLKASNLKGNIMLILPKGHSFPANIAHIRRIGNIVIIHNKNNSWNLLLKHSNYSLMIIWMIE